MIRKIIYHAMLPLVLAFPFSSLAQFNIHTESINPYIVNGTVDISNIPTVEIGNYKNDSLGMTFRKNSTCQQQNSYGIIVPKPVNICKDGKWKKLENGKKVLLLHLKSDSAVGFQFVFKKFHLPEGGKLLFYDLTQENLIGGFTHLNNQKDLRFSTRPINSSEVIIEYQSDENIANPTLELAEVVYLFDNPGDRQIDFGNSDLCHENVNCSPWNGEDYCREIRSAVKILIRYEGATLEDNDDVWGACSGVLINNENEDFNPYILTAAHCIGTKYPNEWTVYYNFQSPECTPNTVGNDEMTTIGMEKVSSFDARLIGSPCDDIAILRVTAFDNLPQGVDIQMFWQYNVFYAGWTRNIKKNDLPDGMEFFVHHPLGDVKKSAEDDVFSSDFRCWKVGPGVYSEYGSSGGPLFDKNHKVIGVHTATVGLENCDDDLGRVEFAQFGNEIVWDEDQPYKFYDHLGNLEEIEGIDPIGVCQPKLQLFGNFYPGNDWQTKNDITIQAAEELEFSPAMLETHILGSPAHMATNHTSHYNFKAGEKVTILPGFHGGTPNEFHISIEPCESFVDCGINYASRTSNQANTLNPSLFNSTQKDVSDLRISPNPTHNIIKVSFVEDFCYTILSVDGKRLREKDCSVDKKASVSTQELPSGVYLLKIEGSKEVYFQKFIKQ